MPGSAKHRLSSASSLVKEVVHIARQVAHERRKHQPSPPAPGQGLVVDVGGGQAPCPRADVVVDKYIADDFERAGSRGLDLTRPLIIADAESLPFRENAFAYVVASHVLEHATDPERFAAELSRIARAGYVQVPSREAELTFGWAFHPWLIDLEDGVLVFHGRDDQIAPHGPVFHDAAAQSRVFGLWFAQHRSTFHHSVDWTGELVVRRAGGTPDATTAQFDVEETRSRIESLASRGLRGPDLSILRVTCCPSDHGALNVDSRAQDAPLECATCGRAYPVVSGVPLLLTEAAV